MRQFLRARALAEKFRSANPSPLLAEGANKSIGRLRPVVANPGEKLPPATDTGELYIYEQIGFDCWTGEGVTGKTVKEALDKIGAVKTLNVYVNSEGGDVFEAKSIYTQLKRFDANVVVHIDGIAASAATFIAMAGSKIITSPIATWMVHQAWSGAMGRAEDMRAMADLLDLENQTIAECYAARTGKPVEEMLALMSAPPDGTWFNAARALELGFTDEIGEEEDPENTGATSNAVRSPVSAALALTQSRLKAVTTGSLMQARADMHRRNDKR